MTFIVFGQVFLFLLVWQTLFPFYVFIQVLYYKWDIKNKNLKTLRKQRKVKIIQEHVACKVVKVGEDLQMLILQLTRLSEGMGKVNKQPSKSKCIVLSCDCDMAVSHLGPRTMSAIEKNGNEH